MQITAVTRFKLTAIHQALKQLGWTQKQLAERAGIPKHDINYYINLKKRPTQLKADAIQRAFGEAGVFVDVLAIWPPEFKGFKQAPVIEQTQDVEPLALAAGTAESTLLQEMNVDPEELEQAIAALPPKSRRAVEKYSSGVSFEEQAKELGVTSSCVNAYYRYGIHILQRMFDPDSRDYFERKAEAAMRMEDLKKKYAEETASGPSA